MTLLANQILNTQLGNPINLATTYKNNWLEVKQLSGEVEFCETMFDICQTYHQEKGWTLMINPENELIAQLVETGTVDISKVLRVSPQKNPIDINKIQKTLLRGNCSVVVLCNTEFSELEMQTLLACAEKGNTHCIVLNTRNALH